MAHCPVCKEVCTRGSLRSGASWCRHGHKWFYCRSCAELRINVGDQMGVCPTCDTRTIDDKMFDYHHSVSRVPRMGHSVPADFVMTTPSPDFIRETRKGNRLTNENDKVYDFIFFRPGLEDMGHVQRVDFRPIQANND